MADVGGSTMAASCVAAAAMILAASAASGLALNASEGGENGVSNPGNGVLLFAHALLREATACAIMADNSRSVEDIELVCRSDAVSLLISYSYSSYWLRDYCVPIFNAD